MGEGEREGTEEIKMMEREATGPAGVGLRSRTKCRREVGRREGGREI